jgi:hypothetical protein
MYEVVVYVQILMHTTTSSISNNTPASTAKIKANSCIQNNRCAGNSQSQGEPLRLPKSPRLEAALKTAARGDTMQKVLFISSPRILADFDREVDSKQLVDCASINLTRVILCNGD